MKKLLYILFFLLVGLTAIAQETPPSGLKAINAQFYIHLPDSTIWQQKGTAYNWHRVAKYSELQALGLLYILKSDSAHYTTRSYFGLNGVKYSDTAAFKKKIDSVSNSGYVTHSYFNSNSWKKPDTIITLATQRYANLLNVSAKTKIDSLNTALHTLDQVFGASVTANVFNTIVGYYVNNSSGSGALEPQAVTLGDAYGNTGSYRATFWGLKDPNSTHTTFFEPNYTPLIADSHIQFQSLPGTHTVAYTDQLPGGGIGGHDATKQDLLPTGGGQFQVLAKNSSTTGDFLWMSLPVFDGYGVYTTNSDVLTPPVDGSPLGNFYKVASIDISGSVITDNNYRFAFEVMSVSSADNTIIDTKADCYVKFLSGSVLNIDLHATGFLDSIGRLLAYKNGSTLEFYFRMPINTSIAIRSHLKGLAPLLTFNRSGNWTSTTPSGTVYNFSDNTQNGLLIKQLKAWTNSTSYALISCTRNSDEAIVSGNVVWPDGATGVFTSDVLSTTFPGAIDAYHVTYVPASGSTKTITQSLLTRDASGAVINQPTLTVI